MKFNKIELDPNLIKVAFLIICFILAYFFLIKLIYIFLPFIIAIIIVIIIEPLVSVFENKIKLPRGIAVFISLSIFAILVILILMVLGSSIYVELNKLYKHLPNYSFQIYKQVEESINVIEKFYTNLPPETEAFIKDTVNTLLNVITSMVGSIAKLLIEIIWKIPNFFLLLVVTLISSFFICKDKDKIIEFIYRQIPHSYINKLGTLKSDLLFAFVGYIKAQLILMCFSFTISAIGLKMIGIEYAVLFALIIGIVDALPILGTGFVFVPWIVINIFLFNFKLALYLSILYGIVLFTRSLLEPKVLGSQIGLYPLITLLSMYIGYQLFGVVGLLMGPITAIIIKALQKMDVIPKWK